MASVSALVAGAMKAEAKTRRSTQQSQQATGLAPNMKRLSQVVGMYLKEKREQRVTEQVSHSPALRVSNAETSFLHVVAAFTRFGLLPATPSSKRKTISRNHTTIAQFPCGNTFILEVSLGRFGILPICAALDSFLPAATGQTLSAAIRFGGGLDPCYAIHCYLCCNGVR